MGTTENGLNVVNDKLKDLTAKVNASDEAVKEIRQAILDKGVSVTADTTLAELPDKIREICTMKTTESSPVGEIISFMGVNVPEHYLVCDGSIFPIGSYPHLEAFFTIQFGSVNYFGGDGTATFAVPDLRGEFLRGSGQNSRDHQGSGSNVGIHQHGTIHPTIGVTVTKGNASGQLYIPNLSDAASASISMWGNNFDAFMSTAVIGKTPITPVKNALVKFSELYAGETLADHALYASRPTNTSVLYCIKYEPTYAADSGGDGTGDDADLPLTEEDMSNALEYILAPETSESDDDAGSEV